MLDTETIYTLVVGYIKLLSIPIPLLLIFMLIKKFLGYGNL